MSLISIVNLADQYRQLTENGKAVSVQWQESESVAFVARGREYRSEFHTNPSDEVIYMIKGKMRLYYRTPSGREEVAVIPRRIGHSHSSWRTALSPSCARHLHFCARAQEA